METLTKIVQKPGCYTGLNEESAKNYFQAVVGVNSLLEKEIIKPFEELLKGKSKFNKNNVPLEETTEEFFLDNIKFTVTSKPTTPRPKYEDILSALVSYLSISKDESDSTIKKKGIVRIENKPYIELTSVFEFFEEKIQDATKKGVSQSINYEGNVEEVEKLVVPIREEGLTFSAGNGELYVRAEKMLESIIERTVKPFEQALEASTGYSKDNVPEKTKNIYKQIGNYLFSIKCIRTETPSYAKVIDSLFKDTEKIVKTTGELRLIERNKLDDSRIAKYQIEQRNGKKYILIESLLNRIDELIAEHTTVSVRFDSRVYPI